ncbi:NAD(P)H-hydrate dehydratase [Lacihabitans lacunae]|uniref:Bifunctional NAD(P)H-hydrate repair enzyme n=1 Tax=Lacihabitans lacunae TaxID=1028214 RepID=A0ABV7Z074_9BACT
MKIFNSEQLRLLDAYTIKEKGIASVDLMERAASVFVEIFSEIFGAEESVRIICGTGNNGGDGLAVARLLHQKGYTVFVDIINGNESADFKINLERLNQQQIPWQYVAELKLAPTDIIIDAIFGFGINRPTTGIYQKTIAAINESKSKVVAIDIPSGLFPDASSENHSIVKATHTISFESPKLAFMMPENDKWVGKLHIAPIGLSEQKKAELKTDYHYTLKADIKPLAREQFGHKGTFGHALLIAGSKGMMGAAVLASKACLRSGVGKITTHIPRDTAQILQISIPEVICQESENKSCFSESWNTDTLQKYDAVGIGPGIGTKNMNGFENFLLNFPTNTPLVIDADAINLLGENPSLLKYLPRNVILTPHPKEFKTLIGQLWENDFEKLELLKGFAIKNGVIICLKGHYTAMALPSGEVHFNSTGNSGMGTAGSGDVLTGIILGFLAQGYSVKEAAIQGVYEHGLAGDRAATKRSERAMIASDIIENFI